MHVINRRTPHYRSILKSMHTVEKYECEIKFDRVKTAIGC